MRRWWWMVLVSVGCAEDPIDEAWNAVFRVDTLLRDKGCDDPVTEAEPPQPFVGLGYARDETIALEALTMFWCESPTLCITLPQANAWLDVANPKRVEGEYGVAEIVAANLCNVQYNAMSGSQTAGGELTLDVTLLAPDPVSVATDTECQDFLDAVAGSQCDERLFIEGQRVD